MRYFLLAGLLAAAMAAGCGSDSDTSTPAIQAAVVDDTIGGRQADIPSAPPGAGVETYSNQTFGFSLDYPSDQFALLEPPQYVTVLGNRVFELVSRTLPQGEIFRPNVGLIVDSRFRGQQISIEKYAAAAPPILSSFFEEFQQVALNSFTLGGHQAATLEHLSSWRAPNGTLVPFHRITLYVENRGDILIFTFTAPRAVFEANRATFQSIIQSMVLF